MIWFLYLLSSSSSLTPSCFFSSLFFPPLLSLFSSAAPWLFWDRVSLFSPGWPQNYSSPVSISQILGLQSCVNIPILNPRICFVSFSNREEHESTEVSWRAVWKSVTTVFKGCTQYASLLVSTQHFLVIMDYVPFKTINQSKSHPLPSFLSGILSLWWGSNRYAW